MTQLLIVFILILQFSAISQNITRDINDLDIDHVKGAIYSPDGSMVAIINDKGDFSIWNENSGKLLYIFNSYSMGFRQPTFSSDSKNIIFHFIDSLFSIYDVYKIYDSKTGNYLSEIKFSLPVDSIRLYKSSLSSDTKKMASLDLNDHAIYLWDLDEDYLRLIKIITVPGADIKELKISSDNKYLFTISYDGLVSVWDMNTTVLVSSFKVISKNIEIVDYNSKYGLVIINLNHLMSCKPNVYDIKSGKNILSLLSNLNLKFSNDGKFIYTSVLCFGDNSIRIWDSDNGKLFKTISNNKFDLDEPYITSKSEFLFTTAFKKNDTSKIYSTIVWDINSMNQIYELKGIKMLKEYDRLGEKILVIGDSGFSPDGNKVIVQDFKKTIMILDIYAGRILKTFITK